MNIIEWMQQFADEALKNNDQARLQLVYYAQQGDIAREANPQVAFQIYQIGRNSAETLNEPCWVLYFAQRMAHICIFELEDLDRAMQLVTRDYMLSTKDAYLHCPINSAIRINLVETYLYYDPVGYADTIQEVVHYLQQHDATNIGMQIQLIDFLAQLHLKLNQLDQALNYALQTIENGFGYLTLTRIYWERGDYHKALNISEIRAEESVNSPFMLADARAWIAAMLMRTNGDTKRATHLHQLAYQHLDRINFVPNSTFYDALAEYQEASSNMTKVLKIRDIQLQKQHVIAGPEEVMIVRLRRARLLGRMGHTKELKHQLADIKKHLNKFKQPAHYEKLIHLIESGNYSDVIWQSTNA